MNLLLNGAFDSSYFPSISTGMARAWDAQSKSTVHVSGQAATVLGRQEVMCWNPSIGKWYSIKGGNTAGGMIEYQEECD